jgi:hypothetical protein
MGVFQANLPFRGGGANEPDVAHTGAEVCGLDGELITGDAVDFSRKAIGEGQKSSCSSIQNNPDGLVLQAERLRRGSRCWRRPPGPSS